MNDRAELFSIGQLAQRTGVSVRTIRFWSDSGVIPEPARSASGYRMYDAEAVARIDLVRTSAVRISDRSVRMVDRGLTGSTVQLVV